MSFKPNPEDRQNVTAFQAEIAAHPREYDYRYVFADWLDEHGYYEEATRQRKYEAAETWLKDFAATTDGFDFDYTDEGDPDSYNDSGYMALLYFLEQHVAGEEKGGFFLPFDTPYGFDSYSDELWENYTIVTGNPAPEKANEYRNAMPPFRCAC